MPDEIKKPPHLLLPLDEARRKQLRAGLASPELVDLGGLLAWALEAEEAAGGEADDLRCDLAGTKVAIQRLQAVATTARECRAAQKAFYANRDPGNKQALLVGAKIAEKNLDELLKQTEDLC